MPWRVAKTSKCPAGKPWGVIKQTDGSIAGCHESKAKALAQARALYASENKKKGKG